MVEFYIEDYSQVGVKFQEALIVFTGFRYEIFTAAYKKDKQLVNILLNKKVASLIKKKQAALRKVIQQGSAVKIPVGGLMSSLAYLDAYCSDRMPTNLIQAQRDYFGAHSYQRIDKEGNFHTEWNA